MFQKGYKRKIIAPAAFLYYRECTDAGSKTSEMGVNVLLEEALMVILY